MGLALLFGVCACSGASPSEGPDESSPEASAPAPRQLERIGVQLYTLRVDAQRDLEGTLRRVAELGYDEVEFAGLFGNDPARIRELLDELGLDAVANHVDWQIIRDDPQRGIDETLALGSEYMVFAWMPAGERSRLEQWQTWVERLNAVAQSCRDQGLRFAYHNHDFEFPPIDGVVPFDLLRQGLDRELVDFELDFYWLTLAGGEPTPLFEQDPGRYVLSHVKDMDPADQSMIDVGQGAIDFAAAFAQSEQSGMRHFFVEHDDTDDPWRTVEVSLDYLRGLRF